ncbi:hypothetical protein BJ912DRAFT_968652 [Pholiota molesta]|nr:hypothetical protein BJ912DRAFT_968652 [Pholiota molesta]
MLHFGSTSPPQISSTRHGEDRHRLEYVSLYPAHGAVVTNGRETISTYIKHRLQREAQILDTPSEDGNMATWTIVRILYQRIQRIVASRCAWVDLHLRKLEGDGWRLLLSPPKSPSL